MVVIQNLLICDCELRNYALSLLSVKKKFYISDDLWTFYLRVLECTLSMIPDYMNLFEQKKITEVKFHCEIS